MNSYFFGFLLYFIAQLVISLFSDSQIAGRSMVTTHILSTILFVLSSIYSYWSFERGLRGIKSITAAIIYGSVFLASARLMGYDHPIYDYKNVHMHLWGISLGLSAFMSLATGTMIRMDQNDSNRSHPATQ